MAARWALQVVTGRYQGTVVPLPAGAEVIVGRESDLDLVLAEDMVSRRHAKLVVKGEEVTIQDLGSTNGTYVNGQKVKRAKLAEGDRILVGASLMRLVPAAGLGAVPPPPPPPHETRKPTAMEGRLEEIPLPDLLQLLAASRKTGVLVLHGDGAEGRIHLAEGKLLACTIPGSEALPARKAFARLLRWAGGTFALGPAQPRPQPAAALEENLEVLLVDGLRELDELRVLGDRLPPADAALVVPLPLGPPLRALAPEELDVFQRALAGGRVRDLLDRSPEPDADVARRIAALVEKGYLKVA
ncbi:MAG TPA: FHA domain-containing protein [Anaeromyxobacteraceae bacterium]|nr:FHA domain-containing protein [Anaeromyxobacteraceae bacterium]